MQDDMPGLVEEREPEDVLPLVAQAQLDDGLRCAQPPCGTVRACFGERRHNHHGDACCGAESYQLRFPLFGLEARQVADLIESVKEAVMVVGLAFDSARFDLA